MDESHRLKGMPAGYDQTLFMQLYKETSQLRKKLAYEIDARKFGVDYAEILSWFDVKFLYVFAKYYHDDKLKGYIINALRTFKYRIIKDSYLPKAELHQTVDIDSLYDISEFSEEIKVLFDEQESLLEMGKKYLKSILSEEAYFLFEIDLNPPPYILDKIKNPDQKKIPKIPAGLIADFLGIGDNDDALSYIENLRKEIQSGIERANNHFSTLQLN